MMKTFTSELKQSIQCTQATVKTLFALVITTLIHAFLVLINATPSSLLYLITKHKNGNAFTKAVSFYDDGPLSIQNSPAVNMTISCNLEFLSDVCIC